MSLRSPCFLTLVVGLMSAHVVSAQTFVVAPNIYTNAEGPGSAPVPIDIQNFSWTFQLVINQNQLTGLLGHQITGIAYRHSAVMGGGYPLVTTTWSNYVIRLGESVAPSAATTTFSNNFTAGSTQVRSGAFTVGPNAWPNNGAPGPNPWGPTLEFDTPFLYTGGHLAMLLTHPGSNNPDMGNALIDATGMSSPGRGTDFAYFAGVGFDVATGNSSNFMPVVRFTGIPAVPEPGAGLLIGTVLAGLAVVSRWRRPEASPRALL